MAKALAGRPRKANASYFTGQVLKTDTGQITVTAEDAKKLERWLVRSGYIDDDDQILPAWHEAKENNTLEPMPPELAESAQAFIALVDTVFDESALRRLIGNGRKTIQLQVVRENLEKRAFQELWSRINQKAVYFSDFDSDAPKDREMEASLHEPRRRPLLLRGSYGHHATTGANGIARRTRVRPVLAWPPG